MLGPRTIESQTSIHLPAQIFKDGALLIDFLLHQPLSFLTVRRLFLLLWPWLRLGRLFVAHDQFQVRTASKLKKRPQDGGPEAEDYLPVCLRRIRETMPEACGPTVRGFSGSLCALQYCLQGASTAEITTAGQRGTNTQTKPWRFLAPLSSCRSGPGL